MMALLVCGSSWSSSHMERLKIIGRVRARHLIVTMKNSVFWEGQKGCIVKLSLYSFKISLCREFRYDDPITYGPNLGTLRVKEGNVNYPKATGVN